MKKVEEFIETELGTANFCRLIMEQKGDELMEVMQRFSDSNNVHTKGIGLIAAERQKQIEKHGFTARHHWENPRYYENNQLQYASTTLLMHELEEIVDVSEHIPDNWNAKWFADLNRRPHKERLIIAGALIAAELDRLELCLQSCIGCSEEFNIDDMEVEEEGQYYCSECWKELSPEELN